MGQPTTLDAVQKGDMVTVFLSSGSYQQSAVKRISKYQIVVDGDGHYSRRTGRSMARHSVWNRNVPFIAVGPEAEKFKSEQDIEHLRRGAAQLLGLQPEALDQATVTTHRAACDQAERALRQLGEWNEAAIDVAQPGRE